MLSPNVTYASPLLRGGVKQERAQVDVYTRPPLHAKDPSGLAYKSQRSVPRSECSMWKPVVAHYKSRKAEAHRPYQSWKSDAPVVASQQFRPVRPAWKNTPNPNPNPNPPNSISRGNQAHSVPHRAKSSGNSRHFWPSSRLGASKPRISEQTLHSYPPGLQPNTNHSPPRQAIHARPPPGLHPDVTLGGIHDMLDAQCPSFAQSPSDPVGKDTREKVLEDAMLGRKKVLEWLEGGEATEESEDECDGYAVSELANQTLQTTLMIKNVPCRFSQEELIYLLDDIGMQGAYDFFYLPMDTRGNSSRRGRPGNRGYAFVNFRTNELAAQWQKKLEGHSFRESVSRKKLAASLATLQGLKNNIAFYAESLLDGELKFRPELPDGLVGAGDTWQGMDLGNRLDYLIGQGVRIFLQRAAPWEVTDANDIMDGDFIRTSSRKVAGALTWKEEAAVPNSIATFRKYPPNRIERKSMVSGCIVWGLDRDARTAKHVCKFALGIQPPPSATTAASTLVLDIGTMLEGDEEPVMGHHERRDMRDFTVFTPTRFLPQSDISGKGNGSVCCTTRSKEEVADLFTRYLFPRGRGMKKPLESVGIRLEEVRWLRSGTVLRMKEGTWCPW